jgi:hypothetical protein
MKVKVPSVCICQVITLIRKTSNIPSTLLVRVSFKITGHCCVQNQELKTKSKHRFFWSGLGIIWTHFQTPNAGLIEKIDV